MLRRFEENPNFQWILDEQVKVFSHLKFFERRFEQLSSQDIDILEDIAGHIRKLAGPNIETFTSDYAWLCQEQLEEELNFRRTGAYRLTTFADALTQVYANKEYMTRYMNGLLMTQLWWSNHTQVMHYFRSKFLGGLDEGYTHLEIGPGHGLFLYFAAADAKARHVAAWDISEASIQSTSEALRTLGLEKLPELKLQDFFESPAERFDSVVFSEVLEHMERPREALLHIRPLLAEGGKLFLNMPINSPAPDHLFNMDTPEDLHSFVEDAGYRILDHAYFPATNQTLEASRRKKLTISCVFIASPD